MSITDSDYEGKDVVCRRCNCIYHVPYDTSYDEVIRCPRCWSRIEAHSGNPVGPPFSPVADMMKRIALWSAGVFGGICLISLFVGFAQSCKAQRELERIEKQWKKDQADFESNYLRKSRYKKDIRSFSDDD